jgi:hypothetical protein
MFRQALLLTAAVTISACTVTPYRQPLDQAATAKLSAATVYARADERGIGVQYLVQDSSAAGASYGLIGALVTATIDAIANAGPLEIAQSGADKLATSFNHGQATTEFTGALQSRLVTLPLFSATPAITPLHTECKWDVKSFAENLVLLTCVEYALTQDLRSLDVALTATLLSRDAAEQAKGKSKSAQEAAARLYRNRLEYHSQPLALFAERTPAEIDAEIAQITAKYPHARRNESDRIAMKKEIEQAKRAAPADKKAEYYLAQWLADDAALLRRELKSGLSTVTELLALDLQDPQPFDTKTAQGLKTTLKTEGERVLVRVNTFPFMGALSSEPVNYAPPASNGVSYYRKPKSTAGTAATTASK